MKSEIGGWVRFFKFSDRTKQGRYIATARLREIFKRTPVEIQLGPEPSLANPPKEPYTDMTDAEYEQMQKQQQERHRVTNLILFGKMRHENMKTPTAEHLVQALDLEGQTRLLERLKYLRDTEGLPVEAEDLYDFFIELVSKVIKENYAITNARH
jgi:predicted nucleotidyltransferase